MGDRKPRLVTLPLSHYCEKARWALDVAGIEFAEEPHLPLLHRRHTRRAGGTTVPVLVAGDATLTDSSAIVQWADRNAQAARLIPSNAGLRSEALEIEKYLDRELGPHARRWAYGGLLDSPALLTPCFAHGLSAFERAVAPVVVRVALPLIRRGFRITPESARRSRSRLLEVFAWIGDKLADGRPFLVGEGFSVADLTFAALAAPVLLPRRYGGRLPALNDLPTPMREDVLEFRELPAGRYALDLYARYRDARGA
jgi:glutathione S-transferase